MQYSHQNCLLLHCVKEAKDENKDEVTIKTLGGEEINTDISHEDLDMMHRIGKRDRKYGKTRPIKIKFARLVAYNVCRNKKNSMVKPF